MWVYRLPRVHGGAGRVPGDAPPDVRPMRSVRPLSGVHARSGRLLGDAVRVQLVCRQPGGLYEGGVLVHDGQGNVLGDALPVQHVHRSSHVRVERLRVVAPVHGDGDALRAAHASHLRKPTRLRVRLEHLYGNTDALRRALGHDDVPGAARLLLGAAH